MKVMHFARLACFTGVVGCAGAVEGPSPDVDSSPRALGSAPYGAAGTGTMAGTDGVGAAGKAGGSSTTLGPGGLTGADAPCDVRAVLRTYCVDCHQVVMYYPQAPTLAFTRSELATKDESGLTLAERVLVRLNDTKDPMPPARNGVAAPSDAERTLISDWLRAGMPGEACAE